MAEGVNCLNNQKYQVGDMESKERKYLDENVLNCATEAQETQEAAQDRRSRPPSSVLAIVNLESNSLSILPVSILRRIPK